MVFSDEDKIAARALSVGDKQALEHADSDYARAILCKHNVSIALKFMSEANSLSNEQMQAVGQLELYLDQQIQRLGNEEGKTTDEISADLELLSEDGQANAENMRVAMACLRRMQEAG